MRQKPVPRPDDPEQSRRFIETAREVGADESPEAFGKAFSEVVRPKEGPPKPSAPRSRPGEKPASSSGHE